MKPRSIVAPLLLIGVGTIFLLHNVWPEIAMYEAFTRYWPFLLILWGVVRLGEVLYWYATKRPLPVAGVSGGEWTWVVLLCVFGSLFFWGSRFNSRWPSTRIGVRGLEIFGERYDFPVKTEKQVGKNSRVVLDLGRGNAKIVGVDGDKVSVTGRKVIQAYNQAEADRGDKETPIEIVTMGDQVIIRTNQDKVDRSHKVSSELEITIPRTANFEGRGRLGDFDIHDVAGNVEINSDNAGVRAQNIGGSMKIELRRSDIVRATNVKGGVDLKGRGEDIEMDNVEGPVSVNGGYSGEIIFRNLARPLRFEGLQTEVRVEKTMGSVRIARGNITVENVMGPVRVNGKVRDVQLRDFSQSAEVHMDRGDIEMRPGAQFGRMDVRTGTGSVDLVLPAGAKFDLTATTKRGEITNDFGAPLKIEAEGKGNVLKGSTGGAAIALNTDRGEITVRRAGQTGTETPKPVLPKKIAEPPAVPKVPDPVSQ